MSARTTGGATTVVAGGLIVKRLDCFVVADGGTPARFLAVTTFQTLPGASFVVNGAAQAIGTEVSSGCFRLVNTDVTDLYERVPIGSKVIIRQKPEL